MTDERPSERGDAARPREAAGRVRVADTADQREDALAVRWTVFVEGQGVPPELERDDHDATATHVVAYRDGDPIGAARLRALDERRGKVERVAVLESYRGEGWGRRLMDVLEATATERGLAELVLHAQTHVEGFYERLGYRTVGDPFEEAGIPHVKMVKRVAPD